MKFKCTYYIDDGFAGTSRRPQTVYIDESEIDEDLTEDEIVELFNEEIQSSFEQKISTYSGDFDKFLAWTKEIQKKIKT